MQLFSYGITLSPASTYRIKGDPNRTLISIEVAGEQTFDMAMTPRNIGPTNHWVDGWAGNTLRTYPHSGDVYLRDTDNQGDEVVRVLSDTPVEVDVV